MSLQYKNKGNVAMDYFVTGADGQLGFEVVREILRRGYRCTGSRFRNSGEFPCPAVKLDITDPNAVYGAISTSAPDVVIHCAAWTAVDDAEESRNRERVFAVNEGGTREIAAACRKLDCKMIYISTDYVFNGRGEDPFVVVCDGLEDPRNLGAVIRCAECAGAHGVIIPRHHSAGITAAADKASAGAAEHMLVARVPNLTNALQDLKAAGLWVYGAEADGESKLWQTDMKGPVCLVIGSEGRGLSRLVRENCDFIMNIPMAGRVNSLNASVAAAILLYEVVRQRHE